MAAAHNGSLLLLLLLLLDVLVVAQRNLNNLDDRKQAQGDADGAEFDLSLHLQEIALHGGFFVPVVEASLGTQTQQQFREETKEGEERKTAAATVAKRYISEAVMCGSYTLATGEAVALATPYFPDNYTDNFDCTWSIKTQSTDLLLTCSFFMLGDGDYLSVQYGQDTTIMFKGQKGPQGVAYHSHSLVLGFHSDCRTQAKGMDCYVDAIGSTPTWATYPVCGLPNRVKLNRITGGTKAVEHQYPWQVLLFIRWSDYKVTCSGALIHTDWVLTASHCLRRKKNGKVWTPSVSVQLGVVTREDGGDEVRQVTTIIIHPKLNFLYDVALLKLQHPVTFTTTIRPICLPPRSLLNASPEGVKLEIAGWGNDDSGNKSNVLNMIERTGMSSAKCKPWFPKYITEHHFCTYSKDRKHICVGDSGGPVMMEVDGRLVLYGVTSFTASTFCNGTSPDGHISVLHFLDWIEQETGVKAPA